MSRTCHGVSTNPQRGSVYTGLPSSCGSPCRVYFGVSGTTTYRDESGDTYSRRSDWSGMGGTRRSEVSDLESLGYTRNFPIRVYGADTEFFSLYTVPMESSLSVSFVVSFTESRR